MAKSTPGRQPFRLRPNRVHRKIQHTNRAIIQAIAPPFWHTHTQHTNTVPCSCIWSIKPSSSSTYAREPGTKSVQSTLALGSCEPFGSDCTRRAPQTSQSPSSSSSSSSSSTSSDPDRTQLKAYGVVCNAYKCTQLNTVGCSSSSSGYIVAIKPIFQSFRYVRKCMRYAQHTHTRPDAPISYIWHTAHRVHIPTSYTRKWHSSIFARKNGRVIHMRMAGNANMHICIRGANGNKNHMVCQVKVEHTYVGHRRVLDVICDLF